MSWPEVVVTSTVHAPAGLAGNAALREYVRNPWRRPPRTGVSVTTFTIRPFRRQTCAIGWRRPAGA